MRLAGNMFVEANSHHFVGIFDDLAELAEIDLIVEADRLPWIARSSQAMPT